MYLNIAITLFIALFTLSKLNKIFSMCYFLQRNESNRYYSLCLWFYSLGSLLLHVISILFSIIPRIKIGFSPSCRQLKKCCLVQDWISNFPSENLIQTQKVCNLDIISFIVISTCYFFSSLFLFFLLVPMNSSREL